MYDGSLHRDIYETVRHMAPLTLPGGAGQNTARLCAHLMNKPQAIAYFGCVGSEDGLIDEYAQIMFHALRKTGVRPLYEMSDSDKRTGTCAVCVDRMTRDRSMCTNIGASSDFTHDFAEAQWETVEKARIIYFTGFFVTASPKTIEVRPLRLLGR